MLSLEEMTTWTVEDIQAQIDAYKAKDLFFRFDFDRELMFWHARFERFDEAQRKRVIVWEDHGADERITLFNAFGWVWARSQTPLPKDSPWRPRPDVTLHHVNQKVAARGHSVPDPEDLDPEEIKAVYEKANEPSK
jgi:hypothetical protein